MLTTVLTIQYMYIIVLSVQLTEIVLSRYDPSNPVVCYDGELRSDLYKKVCGM